MNGPTVGPVIPAVLFPRHFVGFSLCRSTGKFKKKSSSLLELTTLFWFRLYKRKTALLIQHDPRWKSKKVTKRRRVRVIAFLASIYITVVSDRVLTLSRLYAYPSAVLRHASGPTGPRNSSRLFSPFIKSSLPGSSKSRCSRKQT